MNKRIQAIKDMLPNGLDIYTYAPGDGVVRYRVAPAGGTYFSHPGLFTALGLKQAEEMVNAFLAGMTYAKTAE